MTRKAPGVRVEGSTEVMAVPAPGMSAWAIKVTGVEYRLCSCAEFMAATEKEAEVLQGKVTVTE